jgi:hypothetical protein
MIWHSKHQVFDQIGKNRFSRKTECFGFQPICSAIIYSIEPSSVKPDGPVSKTEGSIISRTSDE